MKVKEFNCKKRCGLCCIVAQFIGLTKAEVKSKRYKMKRSRSKGHKDDFEVARKLVYIPEVVGNKLVCFYFEPKTKKCLIYEERPLGCKHFNCADYSKGNMKSWIKHYKQINLNKNG